MANKKKNIYSFLTGLKKTFKNGLIWLLPLILSLLTHANEWLPNAEYYSGIISFLIYLINNYRKNK